MNAMGNSHVSIVRFDELPTSGKPCPSNDVSCGDVSSTRLARDSTRCKWLKDRFEADLAVHILHP